MSRTGEFHLSAISRSALCCCRHRRRRRRAAAPAPLPDGSGLKARLRQCADCIYLPTHGRRRPGTRSCSCSCRSGVNRHPSFPFAGQKRGNQSHENERPIDRRCCTGDRAVKGDSSQVMRSPLTTSRGSAPACSQDAAASSSPNPPRQAPHPTPAHPRRQNAGRRRLGGRWRPERSSGPGHPNPSLPAAFSPAVVIAPPLLQLEPGGRPRLGQRKPHAGGRCGMPDAQRVRSAAVLRACRAGD
jgi:hypothetical protein